MFFLECFWHICFWPRRGFPDGLEKKIYLRWFLKSHGSLVHLLMARVPLHPPSQVRKYSIVIQHWWFQTHHSQNDASSSTYPIENVMPCLFLSFSKGLGLSKRREKERQKYKMKEQNINRECITKGSGCTFTLCCTFLLRSSSNVQQMSGRLRN